MANRRSLSEQQIQQAQLKARRFREQMHAIAYQKGACKRDFFSTLFTIAAIRIELDTQAFFDRAHLVFDEIEAFGQEPLLDDNWLAEVAGEKDTFHFSTDSLVSEPLTLPRKPRQPQKQPDEAAIVVAVEQALDQAEQNVLKIAHAENAQLWIQTIQLALSSTQSVVSFEQLLATTHLQPIELWLGLLLGCEHWCLHQDQFYGKLTVRLRT